MNGTFSNGLAGRLSPHRYLTEEAPGYSITPETNGADGLRVWVREKSQGWALGEFTEIYQVIGSPRPQTLQLASESRADAGTSKGSGYVWLAGFQGKQAACAFLFHWGPRMRAKHTLPRVLSHLPSGGAGEGVSLQEFSGAHRAGFWSVPNKPAEGYERVVEPR